MILFCRADDPEVEVLKLHHYLGPDVNTAVIDAVLEALMVNGNCQALYIQNFNEGFRDEQVRGGGWRGVAWRFRYKTVICGCHALFLVLQLISFSTDVRGRDLEECNLGTAYVFSVLLQLMAFDGCV